MKKVDAISAFGSVGKLAAALGIKPAAVSQWGEDVPPLRVYEINEILNNANKPKSLAG